MALAPSVGLVNVPEMGKEPDENFIKNLEQNLIERYRPRNEDFRTLVNAYHGIYYQNADMRGDSDALGRPMLQTSSGRLEEVPETMNVIKGFADAYKRMLVGLPDPRIPRPPGMFQQDMNGQKMAEQYQSRMKRAAYGIWDASKMAMQQVEAAFWEPVCGSVGMVVLPDFKRGHAIIKYVAPWNIYGIGKMGDDFALSRCIISVDEDYYRVQSQFGKSADLTGDFGMNRGPIGSANPAGSDTALRTVRHTIYLDEQWFVRMIGNKIVGKAHHGLGECPAFICPLILLPESTNRGHSVIEQLLPMQLSINFAVTLWEEGYKDSILPTTWVRNAQSIPSNWSRGRGQLITIGDGGDIGELGGQSAQAMQTTERHVDMMLNFMELNTAVSRPQLQGTPDGSGAFTGRGLEKSAAPYMAGVEETQATQGHFQARALKVAFDMTAAVNGDGCKGKDDFGKPITCDHEIWDATPDDKVAFYGTFDGVDHYEEFTRGELKNVPLPEMSYSPLAHLGMSERLQMVLQMLGAPIPLISWDDAIDMLGVVKDHSNLRSAVESDLAWRVEILHQEQAAQAAQGAAPADALATAAAQAAGATNPDTQRRAGMGPQPAATTAPIPAGGSPTIASAPSVAVPQTPTPMKPIAFGAAALPPLPVAAPADVGPPHVGMHPTTNPVEQVKADLIGVPLKGEVLMDGMKVYVEWNDKPAVLKALGHRKDLSIVIKGKRGVNIPASAVVVSPSATGG